METKAIFHLDNKNELNRSIARAIAQYKKDNPAYKSWFKWTAGRRSDVGHYQIMTFFEAKRGWLGLIKYKPGAFQPKHTDPIPTGFSRHLKFNLIIKPTPGGKFIAKKPYLNLGLLKIFWASHNLHEVTPVQAGTGNRYVLSMSWFKK